MKYLDLDMVSPPEDGWICVCLVSGLLIFCLMLLLLDLYYS